MKNNALLNGKVINAMKRFSRRGGKIFAFLMLLLSFTLGVMANPVDVGRARQVATTFLNNNGARTTGLTDVSAIAGFSNVYVFTTESSFVLMAADDRVQPILGYSLTGRFDIENMPANKRAWIQEYNDGIRYAIENQQRASSEVAQQWRDLAEGDPDAGRAITVVAPLLQTQWDQVSPYNMLCPSNSVTGCVATAMAQVMKYWNYPEHGIGWHSYTHPVYGELSADFQSTTYDWDNMLNSYNGSSTYAQRLAVATLMYHCGVAVDMNYSPNSSGAGSEIVAEALKTYFNYSSDAVFHDRSEYQDNIWINMLKADLNLNRPVWYCGMGSGGGHAFVLDGYNNSNYFHINWGWGGYCDEYYTINNLNPGPGGTGSGSNGIYNDAQGAIFGVHPSDCTANAPSNLTYSLNGRNVTLSWTSASGATSYNIYRDNVCIGNVTSTSYSDIAPFGSSIYYVRSVDSQGRLSLSSNAVTVTVNYQIPVVDDLAATVSGNNVNLSWTAPEWCYPQTPSATISYGDGSVYYSWTQVYYAHRYLASDMAQYANKSVYKIGTYIQYPGTYTVYIYTNSTSNNQPSANSLAATKTLVFSGSTGWQDIILDNPVFISGTTDLWVVMKQENTGQNFPVPSFNLSSYNANACYGGSYSPTSLSSVSSNYKISWFIRAYVTDGTYSYNVYRNGSSIANNVTSTTYSDNNLSAGAYNYYVKTNYYAGESDASNQVTIQIGAGNYRYISAMANPSSGGIVTGDGSYLAGNTCTLAATANPGYIFTSWTKDGVIVTTDNTFSFMVTDNANYMANFTATPSSTTEVVAEYYPYANNPSSQYVRVYWNESLGNANKGDDSRANRSTYCIYRANCEESEMELIAENVTENLYIDTEWPELAVGNYKYGVSVTDGRGNVSEIHWNDALVAPNHRSLDASAFLNPVADNGHIGDPSRVNYDEGWLYYDNGSYATNVGTGGSTIYWGIMFPSSMLASNAGDVLSKVALFENSYNSEPITLDIYLGGTSAPGTLVYTDTFNPIGGHAFHEVELSTPVDISGTQNLWIVLSEYGTYPAAASTDSGDPNGRWISFNGSSWTDLASAGLSGYCWMIRGYLEDGELPIYMSNCIEKQVSEQSIELVAGWNWCSFNVEVTLDDLKAALLEALPGTAISIKSQTQNTSYNPNNNRWVGSLTWDVAKMYMIKVVAPCEITFEGLPINPSEHPVSILNGANWIGFPLNSSMTLSNAFAGFAINGDKIKSQTNNALYNGIRWQGQLNTLEPGKGYIYISNSSEGRIFTFPTSAK